MIKDAAIIANDLSKWWNIQYRGSHIRSRVEPCGTQNDRCAVSDMNWPLALSVGQCNQKPVNQCPYFDHLQSHGFNLGVY